MSRSTSTRRQTRRYVRWCRCCSDTDVLAASAWRPSATDASVGAGCTRQAYAPLPGPRELGERVGPGGAGPAARAPGVDVLQMPSVARPASPGRRHQGVDLLAAARRVGLPVHVWTVNDGAEMERLLARGVDGVMSDDTECWPIGLRRQRWRPRPVTETTTPTPDSERRRQQRAWYFYDWANSAFSTTVVTVFLGPYLTTLAEDAAGADGRVGFLLWDVRPGRTSPCWCRCRCCCRCCVLPVTGAIADRSGTSGSCWRRSPRSGPRPP